MTLILSNRYLFIFTQSSKIKNKCNTSTLVTLDLKSLPSALVIWSTTNPNPMNKIKKSFKNVSMLELTSLILPKSMPKDNRKSLLVTFLFYSRKNFQRPQRPKRKCHRCNKSLDQSRYRNQFKNIS